MKTITYIAAVGLACVLVNPAFAQPTPTQRNPNQRGQARDFIRDRAQAGGGPQAMQAARFAFMLERVLTEEQRMSLRAQMEKQRDKTRDIEEKLRDARRELFQASIAEKFDEEAVRAKALEVGKLDAELTVLRAKAMSQMKPTLSSEQLEQLKNPPPLEGGQFRPGAPRDDQRPNARPRGDRDENDLPPKPKPEK